MAVLLTGRIGFPFSQATNSVQKTKDSSVCN